MIAVFELLLHCAIWYYNCKINNLHGENVYKYNKFIQTYVSAR